ncbi:hypothetical protein IQ251_05025 [Saccharopolyspora sp. HNM0983]|uniref:Mce-associated membrane protein n=1 Tax=Saccharopolyspora montiporae TaxID=2781240 RepID=A0A929G0N7_9PSEU|nr:hypothetical protein [Saccharopolyspora sp. HNM0983]MBE9373808.1 hypothetical protein [Saccharopolyspora sp. HNM0983]
MSTSDTGLSGPESRRRRLPVLLLAGVAVLSATAAGLAATSWASALGDADLATGHARDEVLRQAGHRLVQMNTLDHRRAAEDLDRWQQQVTGPLAEEVARNREDNVAAMERAGTTTTAEVLDSAVTDIDPDAGEATAMAALQVTVRAEGSEPVTKRSRIQAELTKVDADWKLSGVHVVGVSS